MSGRPYLISFLIVVTLMFTLAAAVFPNNEVLIVVRSLQVSASIAVVWEYRRAMIIYWRRGRMRDPDAVLTFAIVMNFIVAGLASLWLYFWRAADEPREMVDAAINGYFVCLSAWCAVLYASAAGLKGGRVLNPTRRVLYLVVIVTVIMSIVGLRGTRFFVAAERAIRPYYAERDEAKGMSLQPRYEWPKSRWQGGGDP